MRHIQRPGLRVVRTTPGGKRQVLTVCHTDAGAERKRRYYEKKYRRDRISVERRPSVQTKPPASTPESVEADMKRVRGLLDMATRILAEKEG